MDFVVVLRLLLGVLLLAMNGFFVTTEFALTRVRQFTEEEFDGHRGLRKAWEMTDRLEIYLSSCQVGITISSVALGVVAEPAVTEVFGGLLVMLGLTSSTHAFVSIVISLAIINILHVIVAEQIPTYLGVEKARMIAKYCAYPLHYWMLLMYPVVVFSDKTAKFVLRLFGVEITRSWTEEEGEGPSSVAELKQEMGMMMSGMPLTEEQKQEVLNAVEINEMPVSEIMVHDEDIAYLNTDATIDDIIGFVHRQPHTRYPLLDVEEDRVVGLVYTKAILQNVPDLEDGEKTLEDIATDIPVVPLDMTVSEVIDNFQSHQQELALVSDYNSGAPVPRDAVSGLVTSTDAMEEITGELEDPLD